VSCSSAGFCTIGGDYGTSVSGVFGGAFVDDEAHGAWLKPLPVPGAGALNTGREAAVQVLSCARGGTCSLGGSYAVTFKPTTVQLFVDSRG
jgi:hypothetical protein